MKTRRELKEEAMSWMDHVFMVYNGGECTEKMSSDQLYLIRTLAEAMDMILTMPPMSKVPRKRR
jgi:hypothetical protein